MKHQDIISRLSLEDKARLCSGKDYWHMEGIPQNGLPDIMLCDGPHGLRQKDPDNKKVGLGNSYPATCFPTAATTACSWDTDMIQEMGEALGDECAAQKVSVLLGPGVNMKRSPLCGRNFEYFSEDPVLAGELGAHFVNGVQSKGIGTSLKHFAVNSQETRRMVINEVVDERTLREIYFPAFETTVKKAQPWTVMNSYNRINGVYSSENAWLQEEVLRGEWGFQGLIVTDWGASVDRVTGIETGTDLEMPTSGDYNEKKIIEAVRNGILSEEKLDKCLDNIIELLIKSKQTLEENETSSFDKEAHHALARKIAANSAVLLKNEEKLLPLPKNKTVAVIGQMAKEPRYQGAGSSLINPTKLDNALDSFREAGYSATFSQGYDKKTSAVNSAMIAEAAAAAKNADVAVVFAGLTEDFESEGFDRSHMAMPESHNALIEAVAAANPNTVVVLSGGAAVEMPWLDRVKAVLHSYLGGQASGSAAVEVLSGAVNPSGHLAETYPYSLNDNPTAHYYPGNKVTTEHREGIYIGYRYYDTAGKPVQFPFGYGLSYTEFAYSDLKLSKTSMKDTDTLTVTFKVKNIGETDGAAVAQLYVADQESTIFRPAKELKAFKKVFLKAGEEKEISLKLDKRAFAYYNVELGDWHVESGNFDIMIGANVSDIALQGTVKVKSTVDAPVPDYRESAPLYYSAKVENVPDAQFEAILGHAIPATFRPAGTKLTILNTLEDAEDGKWGGRINRMVKGIMNFALKMGVAGEDTNSAMMQAMITQIPIRNFISMSVGVFSPNMADGLLLILNDESFIRGLFKILGGVPAAIPKIKPLITSI